MSLSYLFPPQSADIPPSPGNIPSSHPLMVRHVDHGSLTLGVAGSSSRLAQGMGRSQRTLRQLTANSGHTIHVHYPGNRQPNPPLILQRQVVLSITSLFKRWRLSSMFGLNVYWMFVFFFLKITGPECCCRHFATVQLAATAVSWSRPPLGWKRGRAHHCSFRWGVVGRLLPWAEQHGGTSRWELDGG